MKGFSNKQPKIVTACAEFIKESLRYDIRQCLIFTTLQYN